MELGGVRKGLTDIVLFPAPGNAIESSVDHFFKNSFTIGLLGSTSLKPVMFTAPYSTEKSHGSSNACSGF